LKRLVHAVGHGESLKVELRKRVHVVELNCRRKLRIGVKEKYKAGQVR
jgi:hypothetical protein